MLSHQYFCSHRQKKARKEKERYDISGLHPEARDLFNEASSLNKRRLRESLLEQAAGRRKSGFSFLVTSFFFRRYKKERSNEKTIHLVFKF